MPKNGSLSQGKSRAERVEALFASLCSDAPPRAWRLVIALALSLPLPLLLSLKRDLIINYTFQDVFVPMDAAWRTLQGQWPHRDFYTPLGLAYFGQHGAAAWLWGLDSHVVSRASLVALPFVLVPALMFSWRRLNAFSTALLAVFLTVLVTSPIPLDGPERFVAYLASYNALGGALCAVVALWALGAPRGHSAAWGLADAVAAGVVLVILAFLKITFFALAAAVVLAGCVVTPRAWRMALVAAAVLAMGVAALELAHPGLLAGYAADLGRARAANVTTFRSFHVWRAVRMNALQVGLILAMGAAAAWIAPRQRWAAAGFAGVAAACVLVSTQNFDGFSAPLVVLVMLLARRLQADAETTAGLPTRRPRLATAGTFAILMAALPFLLTHATGLLNLARLDRSQGVAVGEGRAETLRDMAWLSNPIEDSFVPEGVANEEAVKWRPRLPFDLANAILTDGLALLQREALTADRIASLSFSDPFPLAFRAPSPRGVALWWDEDRTFAVKSLTPGMVIGDAQVVMVPKLWFSHYNVTDLLSVAQSTLDRDFTPRQSRYWTAWVRKDGAS